MGKWTDKLYITHGEWATDFGGAKKRVAGDDFKGLPFDYCALTLAPFNTPVCAPDGVVFDLEHIIPYIERHETHPTTGAPLKASDLIRLHYSKNAAGEFQCPVTLKVFTDYSNIVVNRVSGRVYSAEGMKQLDGRDYFTNEKFTKSDIVVLQDPRLLEGRNMAAFLHVRQARLDQLESESVVDSNNSPRQALSLSSLPSPAPSAMDEEDKMFQAITKPGRAILRTNLGDIQLELYCHQTPRTCYNFITLARRGYYQGVKFHRLLPGFVIQGGDPTGTGGGGESCWGPPFKTEWVKGLSHTERGMLSMANKGPSSNTSQFFITFGEATHLDRRHPVFGKMVGGREVLEKMENTPTDSTAKPAKPIVIQDIIVLEDPFEEFKKKQQLLRSGKTAIKADPTLMLKRAKTSVNTPLTIGKYIKKPL